MAPEAKDVGEPRQHIPRPLLRKGVFAMRGIMLSVGMTLAALAALSALALTAEPGTAAGNAFHFKVSGQGAEAGWSTCPFKELPEPNVVCTDTFLFAVDQAVLDNGTRFSDKFLFIDQFSFKFDRKGNFVFLSETFGFAGGADVTLSVDRKLTNASASATLLLTTCTPDRRGNVTCSDGPGTVSGSWTGQGDLQRVNDFSVFVSKGFKDVFRVNGTLRNASTSAQIDGSAVPGTQFFGDIFDLTFGEVFVCHGGC
ncbi:MAG: hypothetical protein HYS09_10585 [Chloroflexi bacterium]|nr:hypothetical protein [Chloroflexota bacterium]